MLLNGILPFDSFFMLILWEMKENSWREGTRKENVAIPHTAGGGEKGILGDVVGGELEVSATELRKKGDSNLRSKERKITKKQRLNVTQTPASGAVRQVKAENYDGRRTNRQRTHHGGSIRTEQYQ